MDETPNLRLPYIMAAQAQKHVTHNEAIRALDAILHLSVRDRDLAAPPGSPIDGDRYIVAAPATGDWTAHENEIAAFQDGAWMFYPPREGWTAWLADENAAVVWDGAAWVAIGSGGGSGSNPAMLGINATADATNRLAVSAPASLFSHEGSGHQIKINKASASDTASTLYQTGFEGRAEMGLTGDDDFHFKVSPDGAAWNEAIVIARDTGTVTFPNTPGGGGGGAGRELLSAPRSYYVDAAAGSDTNTGLSGAVAFATIQKAVDTAAGLDLGIHDVTIELADGTYAENVTLKPLVGAGRCYILGDEVMPENVTVAPASGLCFTADAIFATYFLRGMALNPDSGSGVSCSGPGKIYVRNLSFGAGAVHLTTQSGGIIVADGGYTIAGGATYHWLSSGMIEARSVAITLTGTPAFGTTGSAAFASAIRGGGIICFSNTFSGSASGRRYFASGNGFIDANGAAATYLPGNIVGTASTGGEYV